MDVIDIEKTDEHFRLVYDTKGRFVVHRIGKEEAQYKLCQASALLLQFNTHPAICLHVR